MRATNLQRATLLLLCVVPLVDGCTQSTRACKAGTLFVTVQLDSASAAATTIDVEVVINGTTKHGMVPHKPSVATGSIEVDFGGGYPSGQTATVTLIAMAGSVELGMGSMPVTFNGGCQSLKIEIAVPKSDMGIDDLAVNGGDGGDGGTCTATSCAPGTTCVDGVCCSSPCSGQCQACNVAGSVGTCVAVTGAPVGGRTPCAAAGTTCGGACDGTNQTGCAYPGSGIVCSQQSCSSGVKSTASNCDGTGNCPAGQTLQCTPATCNSSGTDCASTCSDDSGCTGVSGKPYCDNGVCTTNKPNGRTCTLASDCDSGNCIDGFCCNQPCTGQCQACDITDATNNIAPGTCAPVTSGQPHNVPASGRAACVTGNATCAGSCAAGQTQSCTYPTVQCGGGTCANAMVTPPVNCASGSCPGTSTSTCPNNLACKGTVCDTGSCAGDTDCAPGYFCGSGGACTKQLAQGTACSTNNCEGESNCNQCATGQCVDGYCCDTACNGQCQACNLTAAQSSSANAKPGTCSTVIAGGEPVAPRTSCPLGVPVTCDSICNGSDATACHYSTAQCSAQSCNGGVLTLAVNCSNGTCPTAGTSNCSSGSCSGTACSGACTTDLGCGTGKYCDMSTGACVPTLPASDPCTRGAECTSTFCVDSVCCGTACSGACQNCSTNAGTCTLTGSAASPTQPVSPRAACPGTAPCQEACNGSASTCVDVNAGVSCRLASCTASTETETLAASCSGGSCPNISTKACAPYMCSGASCATTCTADSQCETGYFCSSGGTCTPAQGNGSTCQSGDGNQCTSGNCVPGPSGDICCSTACNGTCQACGSTGICGVAPSTQTCGGSGVCAAHCTGTSTTCGAFPTGGCGSCHICESGTCESEGGSLTCGSSTCCASCCVISGVNQCCKIKPPT